MNKTLAIKYNIGTLKINIGALFFPQKKMFKIYGAFKKKIINVSKLN